MITHTIGHVLLVAYKFGSNSGVCNPQPLTMIFNDIKSWNHI